MPNDFLTERQRRLLDAVLVLAVIALAFVVVGFAANVFYAFGDILLLFFLAWLLSFALVPLINGVARIPHMPPVGAVVVVYLGIVAILLAILVQASATLYSSISDFIKNASQLQDQLQQLLADGQGRLASVGIRVDFANQAPEIVANLRDWAGQLVGPLQTVAVASIGVFGNVLILVILSIYIAVDRDDILAFFYRLVPPGYVTEARLLQVSVSRSFGGFLRGQLIMGLTFGALTAVVNVVFGLQYAAVTTVLAGVLQMIPFFGPFVSWLPPVAVAAVTPNAPLVPVAIVMGISWFVTMNVLQPRLMSGSVGIHPIIVLASVVIGMKVAGIAGAIFGIPVAAVLSAFFFHWVAQSRGGETVADRAARRVAAREGRLVRRPREPVPGEDQDVDEVVAERARMGRHDNAEPDPGPAHRVHADQAHPVAAPAANGPEAESGSAGPDAPAATAGAPAGPADGQPAPPPREPA
jgi:predicted PurR-regulated permease PerM